MKIFKTVVKEELSRMVCIETEDAAQALDKAISLYKINPKKLS